MILNRIMNTSKLRRIIQFLGVFLFTFLLLETTIRILWWREPTIKMLGSDITLLPAPLVTEAQTQVFETWRGRDDSFVQFDPVLGWSIRPGAMSASNEITYTVNSIGIRSSREYDKIKPDTVTRIAAFGPSFTFGDEVPDLFAWPIVLEQSHPDLEVMNWGVGGYGTDQSFMRYKNEGVLYQPDIVIIGYEEDNIWRNVNRYRPYYNRATGIPLTKPVYIVHQDQLMLLGNPFDNLDDFHYILLNNPNEFVDVTCTKDYFCNRDMYQHRLLDYFASFRYFRTLFFGASNQTPLTTDTSIVPKETTLRLMDKFVKEVSEQQATPIIILFPQSAATLLDYENGIPVNYQEMLPAFRKMSKGYVIDLAPVFVEEKRRQGLEYQDFFTSKEGHYNKLGNQIVARTVFHYLCEWIVLEC